MRPAPGRLRRRRGYTFLELCVVVALLGIMASLALPRLHSALLADDLEAAVRRLAGTLRALRNEAVRERTAYRLHLDLAAGRFWVDSEAMGQEERERRRREAASLPEGIRILDVRRHGMDREVSGETSVVFDRKGYAQPSLIHLGSQDGRSYTLALSPFLPRVGIIEGYAEPGGG